MKDALLGVAFGFVIGYLTRRMVDQGKFDCMCDDVSVLADKTKKRIKDVVDTGKNQMEYIKDRMEHVAEKNVSK